MRKINILLLTTIMMFVASCTIQQTKTSPNTTTTTVKTSSQPITDTAITTEVKSKFISEDLFSSKDVASMTIHVKTINNVVYLTGTADNQTQANNAVRLARSVDGVKNVVSKVRIVR